MTDRPACFQLLRVVTPAFRMRLIRPMLVTLALVLIAACSTLPTDVQRDPSHALEDTSETRLAKSLEPLLDAHPDLSGFHTMSHGSDAFEMRLRLIHSAQKSIDAQYYIWHEDLTGKVLYQRLLEAADRGVRVRVLLDDLYNSANVELLNLIDAHPLVEIRLYNPSANRNRPKTDYLTDTSRVNHRMHSKSFTVDNQAAIFGGRNIADEYFHARKEYGFGDMDVLAVGPIVKEVSSQFDIFWNSEWVYPLSAFPPEEPIKVDDIAAMRAALDQTLQEARQSEYAAVLKSLDSLKFTDFSQFDPVWSKWLFAHDVPGKVETEQVSAGTHLFPILKEGMDRTRRELIIVSPYFVPGKDFTRYLIGLEEQGIQVRVLTNSLHSNDVKMVFAAYSHYRKDLLKGGVELYEFKADRSDAIEAQLGIDRIGAYLARLHAKFYVFDRRYLFIGSFNLDPRSVIWNTELGAYFESPEEAQQLSQAFDERILLISYRVMLNEEGKLEWLTENEKGEKMRLHKEPETTFWDRFSASFSSMLVPERQL